MSTECKSNFESALELIQRFVSFLCMFANLLTWLNRIVFLDLISSDGIFFKMGLVEMNCEKDYMEHLLC